MLTTSIRSPVRAPQRLRSAVLGLPVGLVVGGFLVLSLAGCRPDPVALFLATLDPGEPVELSGDRVLTVEGVDGRTVRGVRLEGPAETCEGTMVLEAPEARVEPVADPLSNGPRIRVVLEEPVAVERCGAIESTTTHERLTVSFALDR